MEDQTQDKELTPEEEAQEVEKHLRDPFTRHRDLATEGLGLSPTFFDRYNQKVADLEGRTIEAERTRAFQEFFTLTAQMTEAARPFAIRQALLDVDRGEVTVTFRTRPDPVEAEPEVEAA